MREKRGKKKRDVLPYILIAPVVIYILCVMVFPFCWALYVSFTDKRIGVDGAFVGLRNYIELLRDPIFLMSIVRTFIFTGGSVILKLIFGIAMAVVLNEKLRCRNIFRSILLLPWTLPTVVVVLVWQWMFSDVGGVLNALLQMAGLSKPVLWLAKPGMAMFSVILVNVWKGTPFIALSVLAGLQNISPEYYEAASIDGATVIQKFVRITLPLLRDVIFLAALMTTIWTLNNFEVIWLLTKGGPSNATNVAAVYSYITAFRNNNLSKAISISVLFLPIMIILINKITKKSLEE
ncbi:MAG TPA: sugar ABC transporter permease [Candidatus Enterocloster excrementigallinarum]|uniref:Sugar ABC transporter permease n=1 Tax=Candidatus Enterocloster excrementigallinarum TaxID=2838558 RepID=A0A9D2PR40_9FIRM|nr:sugar ABC transporter permease [Candidatus Enterocloster excrementigallinarum]